jgi:hypothetical protein
MTKKKNRKKIGAPLFIQKNSLFDRLRNTSSTLSENRALTCFFLGLFFILTFLYYPAFEGDYDVWWHFALGKYYITHHTLKINHAIFSWTPADPHWIYNTWLGSTIDYLIYSIAGGFGLWVFQWVIFSSIFLLFISFVRSIHGKLDVNAIAFIFMIFLAEGLVLVYPKPELFTPLFFTAFIYIFFSIKRNNISPQYFYLYPVMFILWVNLHGGFIVGLSVLAVLFMTECLNYIIVRGNSISAQGLVHLGCAFILVCLACFINPYGWAYLWNTIVQNYPLFNQITGNRSLFMSTMILHHALWPSLLNLFDLRWLMTAWIMVLILCLFILIMFAAFKKKRFFDLSIIFLNPFLFYYGMNTVRACIFFPIFSFFTLFYVIEKAGLVLTVKHFTLFSIVLFLFCGATDLYSLTERGSLNYFGMNLEESIPVKEVELIKKFKLPPPLFNDYRTGGYMIWAMYPEYKVFIDPRGGPYDTTQVGEDYREVMYSPSREVFQRFNDKYPFRVALINLIWTGKIINILDYPDQDWRLLFVDKKAAVLIHKSLLPSLSKNLLQSINISPFNFRNVKNPETLFNLFRIYLKIGGSNDGEVIRDIHNQNVSNFYRWKDQQLRLMDRMISLQKAEERQGRIPH